MKYSILTKPSTLGVDECHALKEAFELVEEIKIATYIEVAESIDNIICFHRVKGTELSPEAIKQFVYKMAEEHRAKCVVEISEVGLDGRKKNG